MIEPIGDMPPGTLGFRAWGEIAREDYVDKLLPAMQAAVEGGEGVRLLFQLGPDFEKFDPGALVEDTKTGITLGLGHLSAWKRTALVTDVEWIRKALHMFAWMTPGEVRLFDLDELETAKEWVAA